MAAQPAITPDGKYAFQTVSIVDASSANATASSTPVLVTDLVSSTVSAAATVLQAGALSGITVCVLGLNDRDHDFAAIQRPPSAAVMMRFKTAPDRP